MTHSEVEAALLAVARGQVTEVFGVRDGDSWIVGPGTERLLRLPAMDRLMRLAGYWPTAGLEANAGAEPKANGPVWYATKPYEEGIKRWQK